MPQTLQRTRFAAALAMLVLASGGAIPMTALAEPATPAAEASATAGAPAPVTVTFADQDHYTDASRRGNWAKPDPQVLDELGQYLVERATPLLGPGETLAIEVTDVDLAGMVEPTYGSSMQDIRILRGATPPAMKLHYTLSRDGTEIASEDARLLDLNYQRNITRISSLDPLRYEKTMIDQWLSRTFRPAV